MTTETPKIGFLYLTGGDASQKNAMIPVTNIAFIMESGLGQPGNTMIQLKQPPVLLPVAQKFETVTSMYENAVTQGGVHKYESYQCP